MAERLADQSQGNFVPQQAMYNLYEEWSRGGWGMIVTGMYP
jgi:2,4-dienoyl-CoA reductase-like NADH-dependent reductase (Old Yellow Enzyme family)